MTLSGRIGDGLKRLIGWLEADVWTPEEAKFLLANQDRDYVELIDDPGPWARILPLRRVPKEREEELYEEDAALLVHAEQLTRGHSAMAPGDWIKLALEDGFEPVWLSMIRSLPIAKKIGLEELSPPPSPKRITDPNSPQARGGHEKRKNGVAFAVEQCIRREFNRWKSDAGIWRNYAHFRSGMMKMHIDADASMQLSDYGPKDVPKVKDSRTVTRIIDRLTEEAGPPFAKTD